MRKKYFLPLLFILCSCGTNTSTTNHNNSLSSNISTSTSSSTSMDKESTSSNSSSTIVEKHKTILNKDLECVLNEDKTGFIIYKYKKYDSYIRIPDTFSGLFSHVDSNKNVEVYSGDKKYAEDVITLPIVGIMDYAFKSSGGVKEICFNDQCLDFSFEAFNGCTTIINYIVSDNHPLYKSIDGVLYSKDGKNLFLFPTGRKDTYSVEEGTVSILNKAFKTSNIASVILPESLTVIEEEAFYSAKKLKSINIPSKVKTIEKDVFNTCSELRTVEFSEGLESIGYYSFWRCEKLINFTLPSTLRTIGESAFEGIGCVSSGIKNLVLNEGLESIGDFAFAYNEYIETIEFPSTLKTIGKYAFMQNYAVKELNLVEGIEELQEGAFFYNTNLTKVNIPSTLKTIGFNCFATSETNSLCEGIEEFVVSNESEYFKNVNGIVYTKDSKELVIAPMAHKFENGIYNIPEGVEIINDHAFYNCKNLVNISLPSTLKEIGKAPFYLTRLAYISYASTMEDFNKVSKEVEIFTSDTSTDVLKVYWYQTSDYSGVTNLTCSDGVLNLVENQ